MRLASPAYCCLRLEHPREDVVHVLGVVAKVEQRLQLARRQSLRHVRIGLQQGEEIAALPPHRHGVALDQAVGVLASIAFSGSASYLLLKAIGLVTPLKVDRREEGLGLDVSQHGEEAYADDEGAVLILQRTEGPAPAGVPTLSATAAEGGRS